LVLHRRTLSLSGTPSESGSPSAKTDGLLCVQPLPKKKSKKSEASRLTVRGCEVMNGVVRISRTEMKTNDYEKRNEEENEARRRTARG
jgi:hypothetical protein